MRFLVDISMKDVRERAIFLLKTLQVVVDLLANGALPDVSREDGWTPLHAAARFGHASTASALVTHGTVCVRAWSR